MNSYDYVLKIKEFKGLDTDYKVCKLMGWSRNKISQYKNGQGMDNEACRQVAEVLEIPVWGVIADMEAMRQSDHEKKQAWIELAKLSKEAGSVAITLLLIMPIILGGLAIAPKAVNFSIDQFIYYTNLDIQQKRYGIHRLIHKYYLTMQRPSASSVAHRIKEELPHIDD
jgi:transcriptional regulator with XRE-family HTH domain